MPLLQRIIIHPPPQALALAAVLLLLLAIIGHGSGRQHQRYSGDITDLVAMRCDVEKMQGSNGHGEESSSLCLAMARDLIPALLASASTIRVFVGRWQIIRARLERLTSCVSEVADSPHWGENDLLGELLPVLCSTLRETAGLAKQCREMSFNGKLLMQSNLDAAAGRLGLHLRDLEFLMRSGVLQRASSAIVVSFPGPGAGREDVVFFVKDLFARLQIGNAELKRRALDSLIRLLTEDAKAAVLVSAEADVGCLVRALESNSNAGGIRDQAALAVSILALTDGCKQRLVSEGALGPLVRMLESGSSFAREKAAAAIYGLTLDSENAWAAAAYGAVPALIGACRPGAAPGVQTMAAGALRNLAPLEEMRRAMADEGAVPVLVTVLGSGGAAGLLAQEYAAEALFAMAAGNETARRLIQESGGVQTLLRLLDEPATTPRVQELAVRAIHGLSASVSSARALVSSSGFFAKLAGVLRSGGATVQQLAASAVCNLSASDEAKKAMGVCIPPLVKMLEAKPSSAQETAAQALSGLLVVQANRREFIKDEKGMARLVQLLDPGNQGVAKKFPVSALLALSASKTCRKKMAMAGACQHLQKLAEMEVAGAKKILRRLAGSRLKNIFSRRWRE